MKYQETKQLEMLLRVREWGLRYRHIFKPESMGRQTLDDIISKVAELKRLSAEQSAGISKARRFAKSRAKAREALWNFMRAMHHTARAIEQNSDGFRKFPLPRSERDFTLLVMARRFVLDATPLAADFIAYEMGEDFIARLQSAIDNLDNAIREQLGAKRDHVVATYAIGNRLRKALLAVKRMDVIIRNRVPDIVIVRAWERASHMEKLRRRAKAAPAS